MVKEELQQFETRKVMERIDGNEMTREEKRVCLQYLMFLKQKKSGRIRGRGCADERKQREFIKKEESSAPTISKEALFLTCIIDALEKRDLAITDIPGAFMQEDMDEIVNMKIEAKMAQLVTKIDPNKYEKYTVMEKGKQVIYVRLLKAIYGTLKSDLLFWENLSETLQ